VDFIQVLVLAILAPLFVYMVVRLALAAAFRSYDDWRKRNAEKQEENPNGA
jgi:hypothetical protein